MKNWRRILVTGLVAGMVAVTGCSSNLPETNQGNRNGQRVVDAVNRRTDSYALNRTRADGVRTTRAGRTARNYRGVRGFNRGFRRAALNDGTVARDGIVRRNYSHRGLGPAHYNHTNTGTAARNIPNRTAGMHNRGRVGHTFGYGQYGETLGLDGGYDLGQSAGTRMTPNAANIDKRVVRNTPATTPSSTTARNITRRSTATTRKTNSTKAVQPTRNTKAAAKPKANSAVTRSTTNTRNIATNNAQPKVHNTNMVNTTTTGTGARPHHALNRERLARTLERQRATRAYHMQNVQNTQNGQSVVSARNVNTNTNRGVARGINGRSVQNSQNRSARRMTNANVRRSTAGINRQYGLNREYGINRDGTNHTTRGLNNNMFNNQYDYNCNVGDINCNSNFAHFYGSADSMGYAVPVSASDSSSDYAFFKRNKANNNAAPETPAPNDSPQVPNRVNRIKPATQPAPVPAPAPAAPAPSVPTGMASSWNGYNNNVENIHDVYDNDINNIHDVYDGEYNDYDSEMNVYPGHTPHHVVTPPTRGIGQRAMK